MGLIKLQAVLCRQCQSNLRNGNGKANIQTLSRRAPVLKCQVTSFIVLVSCYTARPRSKVSAKFAGSS